VVVGLANTMTLLGCQMGKYTDSEWGLLKKLLDLLKPTDILVADRAFAGANHYATYLGKGLGFVTRIHQAINVEKLAVLWTVGSGGCVARMKLNKKYRREDESLPQWVDVRLISVTLKIRGKLRKTWLVTSLLGEEYSAWEIAQLYARRWRVETLLREVKVGMGADVLRSKSVEGVKKEMFARLCAVTIVRTLMVEAAIGKGEDALRVSFVFAVRTIIGYAPAFASEPVWKLPAKYREMLDEIALHKTPWRPDRQEPRAVRREKKHYPTLTTTRAEWRLENAA